MCFVLGFLGFFKKKNSLPHYRLELFFLGVDEGFVIDFNCTLRFDAVSKEINNNAQMSNV